MKNKKIVGLVVIVIIIIGGYFTYRYYGGFQKSEEQKGYVSTVRNFPELGVSMNLSEDYTSTTTEAYSYKDSKSLIFTIKMAQEKSACLLGVVSRINKDSIPANGDTRTTYTHEFLRSLTLQEGNIPPTAKEFKTFFLIFQGPQTVCFDGTNPVIPKPTIREAVLTAKEL